MVQTIDKAKCKISVFQVMGLTLSCNDYQKLILLFLNQNICSGYSKELSLRHVGIEHPVHIF